MPLHLEEHLDAAIIVGSEVPADVPATVEWLFDESQPDWKRAYPFELTTEPARIVRIDDALRLVFDEENTDSDGDLVGGLYVDVPGWQREEWAYVAVQMRAMPGARGVGLALNLTEPDRAGIFQSWYRQSPLMADSTTQTYLLPVDSPAGGVFDGTWRQLGLWFWGRRADHHRHPLGECDPEGGCVRVRTAEHEYGGTERGVP